MKKSTLITLVALLINSHCLWAQWQLGGNNLTSAQRIGSNTNYSVVFETNNAERGRITNGGLWGIGTVSPGARLDVNGYSGQSPFRVQIAGTTHFLIDQYGTVAIGTPVFSNAYKLLISSATTNGIYSNGLDYGVRATSPNIGMQGYGSVKGIFGYSNASSSSIGVNGYAEQGYGGYFESYSGTALYGKTYTGFYAATLYGHAYISGNTYSFSNFISSDKNLKKDIKDVGNALSIINQLKPIHYAFRDDGQFAALRLPKGNHYGLLAQDVAEVLPDLVWEAPAPFENKQPSRPNADGKIFLSGNPEQPTEDLTFKSVNYTELIPILVKAMQEQQQTINQLSAEVAELKAEKKTGNNLNLDNLDLMGISLEQNQPNPVNHSTTFRYTIPPGAQAQILVFDGITGKQLKTLIAPATGQVEMDGSDLKAGTYIYSLMVNSQLVASKHLILQK